MSTSLVNSVRQYLASHYMYVVDDWLAGCVEYLSEDTENNYTEADIKNLAKEQWLLNDLKDICPGSLPANLKGEMKTVLNGNFVLQINAVIDIGTPAYQQYLKLQRVNMENVEATTNYEDKISSHRMLKLYLTDGVQEICGLEYKPMRNLSADITPGCKILIKGPVDCRRGQLLLTESAIELLGGEVQEIGVSNSLAGQLSTKLGLPMTQEPDPNTTISIPRNTNIPTPHTTMPPAFVQPAPTFDQSNHQHSRNINQHPSNIDQHPTNLDQQPNFADDDIDIDQLAALEEQLIDNPGKRPLVTETTHPEKRLKTETVNQSDDYPDDNDIFFNEDEDYLREIEAEIGGNVPQNTGSNKVSTEPFVYLKQIKELSDSDKLGKVFKIKGQVMSLLSKLSVSKEGWSLKCTIVDGTDSLDVEFTSDVLSKLVGYTPTEMNAIKKQMATKPELKEKAISALLKAKESLQVLYCIIELTIQEVPRITDLIPFDATHIDQLNRRVNS
ncbi:recQ-mediated genome instability protein 1-like [Helicoverpa armigera]|uniref:recQ-mediated genome instability protein 1-like n=1 Tax=Helicoverpa armigera TaxID=29058 RepID=UPI00308271B5